MKILLATSFPQNAEEPRGGVEAVSVVLADALGRDQGLEVHLVTADATIKQPEQQSWNGVTVHRLPWRARRMLTGALGAEGRAIASYVRGLRAEVVHAHDTYGIMLQDLETPKVLTIHGFIHADTSVSGERWAAQRAQVWRLVERRAWARYPHLISISPYVRERLTGIAKGVIHDIDNPTARPFFDVSRQGSGAAVFCAAAISPRKNTLGLIEAFARLHRRRPDAVLRIAGTPSLPEYGDAVQQRIRELGLQASVFVLGSLSTAEIRDELSRATVMALLSLEENSPLSVQEAMAAGVPVVTSNRCGMPYQVVDGETGFLVDPLDPDNAAVCLGYILDNEPVRAAMSARARAVACARFHPEVVAERTRAVYEAATGRRFTTPR